MAFVDPGTIFTPYFAQRACHVDGQFSTRCRPWDCPLHRDAAMRSDKRYAPRRRGRQMSESIHGKFSPYLSRHARTGLSLQMPLGLRREPRDGGRGADRTMDQFAAAVEAQGQPGGSLLF